jgi:predicted aldo/keto reductase-like oxidoreductase
MMNAVSLVARHIYDFEGKVWPEAARKGVGLAAMKVFGGGQPGQGPKGARLPDEMKRAAVRYALGLPNVSIMVLGIHDEDELKQNLAWVRAFTPLTADELKELAEPTKALAARWGKVYGEVT